MNIVEAIKAARNGNKVYRDIVIDNAHIVRSWMPFVDLEQEEFTVNEIIFNRRFVEITMKEDLTPKYEMRVIDKDNQIYNELKFTSLTDFQLFLNSDHYDKIVHYSDDEIIVVHLETTAIVFSSKADD
jgi:hypothetical protein